MWATPTGTSHIDVEANENGLCFVVSTAHTLARANDLHSQSQGSQLNSAMHVDALARGKEINEIAAESKVKPRHSELNGRTQSVIQPARVVVIDLAAVP